MLQFLFGDRPKEEQFSSGEIEFVSGRVAKLEITATVAGPLPAISNDLASGLARTV